MIKEANIKELLRLKRESDRKNYGLKASIFRNLYEKSPSDFIVDSREDNIYGITHVPTTFRFHLPEQNVPDQLRDLPTASLGAILREEINNKTKTRLGFQEGA